MQHYQWHKSTLFYTSSHSPWTLTQQFWLSGTHQQTHREKCEAVGLVLLQVKLSPRLAHATERFVPCIADCIPCSGKNTSGDAALHWGFLRAVYQKQEHQLYHQLEWFCGCGLGKLLPSSKLLDPVFFSTGTILYHSHTVVHYLINWSDLCCPKKVH